MKKCVIWKNSVIASQTSSLKSDWQCFLIYRIFPDDLMHLRASNGITDPWNNWYLYARIIYICVSESEQGLWQQVFFSYLSYTTTYMHRCYMSYCTLYVSFTQSQIVCLTLNVHDVDETHSCSVLSSVYYAAA